MIKYSILDQAKQELSENTTVRFDEGEFTNTVICFNPITLNEDETISYGIDILRLTLDGTEQTSISSKQKKQLLAIAHKIFLDLLLLFKGEINYET